jgi:hypothetical protein
VRKWTEEERQEGNWEWIGERRQVWSEEEEGREIRWKERRGEKRGGFAIW